MTYTFKDGTKVEGTLETITSIAKALGEKLDFTKVSGSLPRGYYLSDTKGLVKIGDMNDIHIRNALLKQSKLHFEILGKEKGIKNSDFLVKFTSLPENPIVGDLYTELAKRK